MSSTIRITDTLHPAPHATLRAFTDSSKPPTSIHHIWIEQTWDPPSPCTPVLNVPLHWHARHDESLEILSGAMEIYHHGAWHVVTPSSGIITAERGSVHGFRSFPGVRVVIKETASPAGDYKVAFFRDMSQTGDGEPGFWLVARVAFDHDLYPWVGRWKWVDWLVRIRGIG